MAAFKDTDKNYEEIYKQYADEVYRFLYKLTQDKDLAEEFTQECFFKAFLNYEKFLGGCKLSVWLCQIAKNCYFDYCKKRKPVELDENTPLNFDLEDMLAQKDFCRQIHRVLHTLEEPYKEVFTLKVFGELSYNDISALFDKSKNWSRVTFFRAKTKLLERLQHI